jgi:hypothetical protein
LRRWIGLIRPGGRLVLIEGRWATPAEPDDDRSYDVESESMPWMGGVRAESLLQVLRPLVTDSRLEPLTDPTLWGRPIQDERYAVIALT